MNVLQTEEFFVVWTQKTIIDRIFSTFVTLEYYIYKPDLFVSKNLEKPLC